MKLIMLGTGAPRNFVRNGRYCTSVLVSMSGDAVLFDCGGGATAQLLRTAIDPWAVNDIFFTHHHYDHNADYPLFVLARWDMAGGKAAKLYAYGPKGTKRMNDLLFGPEGIYYDDIQARLYAVGSVWAYQEVGGKLPRHPPEIEASDIFPGFAIEKSGWKVSTAIGLHAQPFLDELVYRIDSSEGSVTISGDSAPTSAITTLATESDVLVQNITEKILPGWMPNSLLAGKLASEAKVKKLVLTHLGHPQKDKGKTASALADAKQFFDGEVFVAEDLMEIPV